MQRLCFALLLLPVFSIAQDGFLRGADLSYVNEMEDCGAMFSSGGEPEDPYLLFAEAGCAIVRLRLWHTPSWYDTLNAGQRYSDFEDVCRSAERAREAGMQILLDFHLSDFWADPGRQWIPAAWAPVADDLPVLQDSLYNYIYSTLTAMHERGLLPEMVQVGNETNRGILLPQAVNDAGWVLDWDRNGPLFQSGLQAVTDVEAATGQNIRTALHIAGPTNAHWLMEGFANHGVTDFDIIGLSYYWQWHMPATIGQTGSIIGSLRETYPDKEVMIFETGYPWTLDYADAASNILTTAHPDYAPLSPQAQKQWMLDLEASVRANGGSGLFYWEPAWVSTDCYTPWGQGSHKENATFFDFDGEVLDNGGMDWLGAAPTSVEEASPRERLSVQMRYLGNRTLSVEVPPGISDSLTCQIFSIDGKGVASHALQPGENQLRLAALPAGQYVALVQSGQAVCLTRLIQLP
ncbi:MAG: glycosyl hydrolase 53 family protein [Phaeodactylibacter sp.]|uniref:glycoside hydrolase family 53 protein n=1 Tax=Phaeodactylibacter sp. TaxID=1940289 RepID=UPI0032ED0E8B